MTDATDRADGPPEVEVSVVDGAAFELCRLDVDDAEGTPRSFLVEGFVDGVDRGDLRPMCGRAIEPVAVRFEVGDGGGDPVAPAERTVETCRAGDEPVTATVVRGLAAVEGVEPDALEPLYDHVDPDAIDALCGSSGRPTSRGVVTVTFTARRHLVRVRSDGTVAILVAAGEE